MALDTELRTRDRSRYRQLHVTLREALLGELRVARAEDRPRIARDLVWLHRFGPVVRPWADWEGSHAFYPSALRASDHQDIVDATRRFEGEECARAVGRWLELQPSAFTVVRASPERAVGYVMNPRVTLRDHDELAHDPRMQAAVKHAQRIAPIRDDESVALVNWLAYATFGEPTPGFVVGSLQIILFFLSTPRLAWTFMPILQRELWLPLMNQLGHEPGPEIDLGTHSFVLCAHDWRLTSTSRWFDRLAQDEVDALREPESGAPAHHTVMTREVFVDALRVALQRWGQLSMLAQSPLLRSRLVCSAAAPRDPEARFRSLVTEIVENLKQSSRHARYAAALEATYLRPAPTQERAAERLGLPFSTYRRHLGRGLEHLANELWERELSGP
ncbi:MAG: hypothetical protein QM778_25790 [Myxococcales bacterium]